MTKLTGPSLFAAIALGAVMVCVLLALAVPTARTAVRQENIRAETPGAWAPWMTGALTAPERVDAADTDVIPPPPADADRPDAAPAAAPAFEPPDAAIDRADDS